ncbi:ATP-grasp domain-containing protein [Viridibacillus sp. NPDC093762]|uniref:ATP-grasp domain-containing protein n=1 Tax=Viridibacillus sp. NPDC093762 TaxID=3390720 RepID=UPI003D092301
MKSIIFIETTKSGSSREAIKAAARLGFLTVLLTERESFMVQRKEFPDVSQMIHTKKITEDFIRTKLRQLQQQGKIINAIVSFVDPFVSLAVQLMNELCESGISVEALKLMEDKTVLRTALRENATTPYFEVYQPTDDLKHFINRSYHFPLIIKSAVSKGSKDVHLVENEFNMKTVMKKILTLYPNQNILLEEYLDGPQYLVELLVHNGKLTVVAVFKQDITKKIKFIITGYDLQLTLEEDLYDELYNAVESIINDLGVTNAACHIEIRYVNGNWKLVEINPRISGGAMNRMIEEAFGTNLVEETIKLYLGYEPDLKRKFEKPIYTHYLTSNSYGHLLKVTGKNKAAKQPGVREVYIKPRKGATIMPPLSMGHRYGYVIASGDSSDEAKRNAVNAASNIKFYLDPI